jgi:ABC-type dipeptide/oligopeptide/nickel transport system permease subunit
MVQNKPYKSPSYYIKKRFLANKPAIFGLILILFSCLITFLGYSIMPDSSKNANDGAVEIKKKPPFFKVTLLKVRKKFDIETPNFVYKMFMGEEKTHSIIPLLTYRVEGDKVHYVVYTDKQRRKDRDLNTKEQTMPLVMAVKQLYAGESTKLSTTGELFSTDGNKIRYLDSHENIQTVELIALQEEFKANNIENRTYYLGTDLAGRDMLSRLLFGTRISLAIGFISLLISLLVGITLGALGGFFGGATDNFVNWLMTVVWSIPSIMLVIAISLALQSKGIWVAFVAVGLTMWVDVARAVRGEILTIKQKLFVEAARAFGLTNGRIIYRHILPNILGSMIVISSSNFASAILVEAGLSFLGLGVQPPMPSWGMMVNEGFHVLNTADSWHLILFPSLAISLLVLAFNLLGNGLRDAYDPKTQMQ